MRDWLKRAADDVWWVENKRGGTSGFPDAIVVDGGMLMFLELKLVTGMEFVAAPSQINVLRGLKRAGQRSWVVGAVKCSEVLWSVDPENVVRKGETKGLGRRARYVAERVELEAHKSVFLRELRAIGSG